MKWRKQTKFQQGDKGDQGIEHKKLDVDQLECLEKDILQKCTRRRRKKSN